MEIVCMYVCMYVARNKKTTNLINYCNKQTNKQTTTTAQKHNRNKDDLRAKP